MGELESLESIGSTVEQVAAAFEPGIRVEKESDRICIYDTSGQKRYLLEQREGEGRRHSSLSLEGRTSGGSWHTLMGAYENLAEGEVHHGVEVQVPDGPIMRKVTAGAHAFYVAEEGSTLDIGGYETGYYGSPEVIAQDLERLGAVAQSPADLPKRIDVDATTEAFVANFQAGIFEAPDFALPPKRFRLPSVRRRAIES